MTKTLARIERPSSRSLLARVLETPDLAAQIEALAPPALASLIDRIGLEDAGELVAFATPEQLAHLFDHDLWKSDAIGEDETFDGDRFLVWLEVMLEAGDAFVADKLASLPEDLVALAFHTQILVVPLDTLTRELEVGDDDARATEKALASCLSEELDDYQVIARHPEGWDNVLAAILALDRDHHDDVARLLARCSAMSAELIDDGGGLYDVLTSEQMLEGDVAGDREDRRAEAGHVAPSAARAFLKLARREGETPFTEHDPMTRAYFRNLARDAQTPAAPRKRESTLLPLLRALSENEETRATHRLAAHSTGPDAIDAIDAQKEEELLLVRTMRALNDEEPRIAAARSEELAYLANVLGASASLRGRRFRPAEAVRGAVAVVSLGLALFVHNTRTRRERSERAALELLRAHPADALFRYAWRTLHDTVARPAAIVAECTLRSAAHRASREDAAALTRSADRIRAVTESAPWKGLGALDDVDGLVDSALLQTLRGAMDECPHLTGALPFATPEESQRDHAYSRERFAHPPLAHFISTPAELARVTRFLDDQARRAREGSS